MESAKRRSVFMVAVLNLQLDEGLELLAVILTWKRMFCREQPAQVL